MAYNIFIQVNTMQDKNKQAWITAWLAKEATTAHRPQATLVSIWGFSGWVLSGWVFSVTIKFDFRLGFNMSAFIVLSRVQWVQKRSLQ